MIQMNFRLETEQINCALNITIKLIMVAWSIIKNIENIMSHEWFNPDIAALFLFSCCEIELKINYLKILDLLPLNSKFMKLY